MTHCENIYECMCDSLEGLIEEEYHDQYHDQDVLDYQKECGGHNTPLPNPLPHSHTGCRHPPPQCSRRLKLIQNKWTVRHTRGNVLDWWDRVHLEHETVTPGCGRRPRCGDLVTITYVTKDLKGMGLDWSRKPYRFRVGDPNVMKGLSKGIILLEKGETAKLYIPSGMAYGWEGVEGMIKPHTDIIMKVTILKISK